MAEINVNDTIPKGAPITGGETKLVINETIIRQVPRLSPTLTRWRSAHLSADNRQYPNRTLLYNLYDETLLDMFLFGIIEKRILTVLNKKMFFLNASGDSEPLVDKFLGSLASRKVKRAIVESEMWGISGLEAVPGKDIIFKDINRKHIKTKWQLISYEENGNTGIDYTTASNLYIIGEDENLGLLLRCVPNVTYKRDNTGDWAQYIEIFGQPIRVMYYDAYDQQTKIELKQTLDASGGSLALMIPKGVEFDIKDGKVTNGDGSLQKSFKDFFNEEFALYILGNTETSMHNGKTGTGAKSQTHSQQQDEILKSDLTLVEAYFNNPHFLNILASYGLPVQGGTFAFHQEINADQILIQSQIDATLKNQLGLPLDDDELYTDYGRTKPKDYDAQKAKMQAQKQPQSSKSSNPTNPNSDDLFYHENPEEKEEEKEELAVVSDYGHPGDRSPDRRITHSKLKNLLNALSDFFVQARH